MNTSIIKWLIAIPAGALFVSVVNMNGDPVETTLDQNYIEFEWFDN